MIAPLREQGGIADDVLAAVEDAFNVGVYGDSGKSVSGRQPLLLGLPEVEYLCEKAAAICAGHAGDANAAKAACEDLFSPRRGEGANFRAFRETARLAGGLEGALFGRMVTSDPGANIDAAVHVAHAFTVHREESESDYFSVVDDLQGDNEDAGAAHIGDMELTAGLFYGYVVVDVPGLVSNLEGCDAPAWESADRELAAKVVEHLTHLIATVSPGAKLGSTAPYACADLMLIEAGSRQPRSLANAFRDPVERTGRGRRQTSVWAPGQAGRVLRRQGGAARGVGRGLRGPRRGATLHGRPGVVGCRRRTQRNGGVGSCAI